MFDLTLNKRWNKCNLNLKILASVLIGLLQCLTIVYISVLFPFRFDKSGIDITTILRLPYESFI